MNKKGFGIVLFMLNALISFTSFILEMIVLKLPKIEKAFQPMQNITSMEDSKLVDRSNKVE